MPPLIRSTAGLIRPLCTVWFLLALAATAFAADTGSVSGVVFDQTGAPVEAATVKISGDRLVAGRTAQTSANGVYKFEYLLPGDYTVEIDKLGVGSSRRPVSVS